MNLGPNPYDIAQPFVGGVDESPSHQLDLSENLLYVSGVSQVAPISQNIAPLICPKNCMAGK